MTKPIALFNAYPPRVIDPAYLRAYGVSTLEQFQSACGPGIAPLVDIDIEHAETLPQAHELAGVIFSGSATMVTDRLAWTERAAAWIRQYQGELPILGVCFGHQLVAHALGGTVAWTPSGPEYSTITIETAQAAKTDPLFAGLPQQFLAQSAHHQSVVQLPDGGNALAYGRAGLQAAQFAPLTWGVQFHPEMDDTSNRALVDIFRGPLQDDGLNVETALAGMRPSTEAPRIIANFAAFALNR